jgi:putative PIN family toxin of toxin-antitoxin system
VIVAVLDTNLIVSATLIRGGNEDRILRAWQAGKYALVLSGPILQEVGRVLFYEKIRSRQWMTGDDVERLLRRLAESAIMVPGRQEVRVCRDPGDDKFLAAALEGKAQYVVSGDRDLTHIKAYRGVRIILPRQFLEILPSVPSNPV